MYTQSTPCVHVCYFPPPPLPLPSATSLINNARLLFTGLPLTTPHQHPDSRSALHLYPIRLHATSQRRQVFEGLRAAGIGVNVHYIPVHTQPHYRRLGFRTGDFPAAENYYAGAISLPMFPPLTPAQQDEVIAVLKRLLG